MIKLQLFVKELILFSATLGVGLYAAHQYLFKLATFYEKPVLQFTFMDVVVLAIIVGAVFLVSRHKRAAHISFRLFLILVVFSGTQVVFGSFASSPWDLLFALIFTILFTRFRNVLTHNVGMIFGIAGIGAVFGLSISLQVGLVLLVALSFYDVFAVYVTKHMVTMARSMIESGAVFGFLIPSEFKGFLYDKKEARAEVGHNFMILGSGDVGLPLVFVTSVISTSLSAAMITGLFSLAGLFVTHLLFVNQVQRRPMAALPPIATLTIVGYLISQLWLG